MRIIISLFVSLFSVLFCQVSMAVDEGFSRYIGLPLENGFTKTVTFINEESLIEFDLGSRVHRCDNEHYYCIKSKEFLLALPKNGNMRKETWTYKEISFSHVGKPRISFMDKDFRAHLIVTDQNVNFLFSEEYGLVAYIIRRKNKNITMLLSNMTGIGSYWYKESYGVKNEPQKNG